MTQVETGYGGNPGTPGEIPGVTQVETGYGGNPVTAYIIPDTRYVGSTMEHGLLEYSKEMVSTTR